MLRTSLAGSVLLLGLSVPLLAQRPAQFAVAQGPAPVAFAQGPAPVALAQVPAPFPRPAQPGSSRMQPPVATQQPPVATPQQPPAAPTTRPTAAPEGEPTESTLGASIYPSAQYLQSYDAGRGQRYYLYGSEADFLQVVAFYRTALKQRGELIFDEPPMQMFELGRFREDTMAFAPSVTVKDYTWAGSQGYLNPKRGGTPERFRTIIQIVPSPSGSQKAP